MKEGAAITINRGSSGNLYLTDPMVIIWIKVKYAMNPNKGVSCLNEFFLVIRVAMASKITGNKDRVAIIADGLFCTIGVYGINRQNRINFTPAIFIKWLGS